MVLRFLNRLGAVCLAIGLMGPCALALISGGGRLILWFSAQRPNHYASAYPFLADAVPWMALGLLGLLGSLAVITSGQRSLRWLWFPTVTLLYSLVLIMFQPNYHWFLHRATHPMVTEPVEWAKDRTRHDFRRITSGLTVAAKANGAFACPVDDLKMPSHFMVGGQILMYEVQCVERGLDDRPRPALRPALIVMTVSEDRREARFQVTTLADDMGQAVTWVTNYSGKDMVLHESIKPTDQERTNDTKTG